MNAKIVTNDHLQKLRESFFQYLINMGYKTSALENFKWVLNSLERYMHEHEKHSYSSSLGAKFVEDTICRNCYAAGSLKMLKRAMRRFDDFASGNEHEFFPKRAEPILPKQFKTELEKYLQALQLRGLRDSTIQSQRRHIVWILIQLGKDGICDLSFIKPADIYRIFESSNDKHHLGYPLRSFLRYLFKDGKLAVDYSGCVPSVRKKHPVPSIYTKEETCAFLDSFNRDSVSGKRNYAIVLLALRLGMRSGDIVGLQISDIDFQHKKIFFTQKKTQVPQSLELLPEIDDALEDYLFNARPSSDLTTVFLSLLPPFRPMCTRSIYYFVWRHFVKSGIDTGNRKCGPHALRMTLASELVAEKVPYVIVSKILGHESPLSAKHYIGFDIESLRTCSIGVPPLSGSMAKLISGDMGGLPL